MGLELGYVRLDLPSHVLRAAPEGEHVVAVREARHFSFARVSCSDGAAHSLVACERGCLASPVQVWGSRAAAAATGERDSTANGLPVERRSEGCRWGVGRGRFLAWPFALL